MIAIEHAVFDIGNVLAFGGEARLEKAQERWGRDFTTPDFRRMLIPDLGDGVDYWRRFQDGLISTEQYLSAAVRAIGLPDARQEREYFEDCLKVMAGRPYDPAIRLVACLKERYGLTIGVLTNNNAIMYDAAFTSGCADVVVSSHHVHVSKPSPDIYRMMLAGLSDHAGNEVRPGSVLFIDDKVKNVEAARELGMHGFVFPSRSKIMGEALADLLGWLGGLGIDIAMGSLTGSGSTSGT